MSEFILNLFEFRITPVGERRSKAITFKHATLDSIKVADDHLLNIKNKVHEVCIFKDNDWSATRQCLYFQTLKREAAKGVFYGEVEVGSAGSFHRLRRRSGTEPYKLTGDDLVMRSFFFRVEMPPDSSVGFLVVQRHGRNTAANAIQQTLKREFYRRDHTAHFDLVTDKDAFDEYLSGRVAAIRALYVPQKKEARKALNRSIVLGSGLSRDQREDMDIKLKVNRPITKILKQEIKKWLTTDDHNRPDIVTLPVDDNPDRLILCIETDDGRQKQLHPGMIADMALSVDKTADVKRDAQGVLDLESANKIAETLCSEHRPTLAQ